jgi:SAM-dependent methyltransferase
LSFKDHFSTHAPDYAAFRPGYPPALFRWLAAQCHDHSTAWDCACGNGQAARGLAGHFRQVIATDASRQQIESAKPQEGIEFRVAKAETSGLEPETVDLITVAQAAHWFDLASFYAEARRVLRPGGVIALWGYGRMMLPGALDAPLAHFYEQVIGRYWPPERALIDDAYRSLAFPFKEIDAPRFSIDVRWNLPRLIAYLSTWSAVKRYTEAQGMSPLPGLEGQLAPRWGSGRGKDGSPETVLLPTWPLFLRVGRY